VTEELKAQCSAALGEGYPVWERFFVWFSKKADLLLAKGFVTTPARWAFVLREIGIALAKV
jgi:hypothetical protein